MRAATKHRIRLGGSRIDYRIVRSRTATQLRVRVGPNGVEVVKPAVRNSEEVPAFLRSNEAWILEHLERVQRLPGVVQPGGHHDGEILFRGKPTRVRIVEANRRARENSIAVEDGEIVIRRGCSSRTPVARSLERWFRRRARERILQHLAEVTASIGHEPGRLYVMGQRTKWGNCSAKGNLSFNWRLILAPDSALRYVVTHEAVHLVVPDHSARFWLTVQSLCPETERAKQWLCRHQAQLTIDLDLALNETSVGARLAGR